MKNKIKKIHFFILGVIISSVLFFSFNDDDDFELKKNLDIYYTLLRELNIYYVDEIDAGKIIKKSMDEMLQSLDPYTVYIPESDIENYRFMTTGQYGGIGALIDNRHEYIVVAEPYLDFPAYKAGLRAGDIILEISGETTKNKTIKEISRLLKGSPETSITILVKRPFQEEPFSLDIVRQEIKISNVPYYGMLNDKIGYIKLTGFTNDASSNVRNAFNDLKENENITGLVLDLRNNPGGLLMESVHIVNLFVDKDTKIVSTKGKVKKWNSDFNAPALPIDKKIPIVVLVNRGSASASEIVSGALQDLDRAIIIGQRTYGKGLVQATRPLTYNAQLKITTAKYYIPSGRCIQALDYSHRNADGSVGKVPDSLTSEFRTATGRIVKDGGGILPDIVVDEVETANITQNLGKKYLFFDFATKFYYETETIESPEKFTVDDQTFEQFKTYVAQDSFEYNTNREDKLNSLIKTLKDEKLYQMVENELNEVKQKIKHDMNLDLDINEKQIRQILTNEIVSRYYFQEGRIKNSLTFDVEIDSAISVLNNPKRYYSILNRPVEE